MSKNTNTKKSNIKNINNIKNKNISLSESKYIQNILKTNKSLNKSHTSLLDNITLKKKNRRRFIWKSLFSCRFN